MFNENELKQLAYFLQKSVIQGNESASHAILLQKIDKELTRKDSTPEAPSKEEIENKE